MLFRRHQEAARRATHRLALLFVLIVVLLVVAVNALLALAYHLSFPIAHGYPAFFFQTNTALVLLFVLGGCAVETSRLRDDAGHIARAAGGRPAQTGGSSAQDRLERRFANVVQEIALASRWRAPAPWVLPRDDAINAFAAGWRPDDAVIAVTRGALERLSREELQGVVAHEFSHLVNGDTRLNMQLVGLVWGLQMVFGFGQRLAEKDERGHRPAGALFGFALMAVGSLGWLAGRLLRAAMSRQREYLADASAVQFTRQVDGLGGALRKIAHQAEARRDRLLGSQAHGLAHLYLHAPGRAWWSAHPPIAERLRRLYGHPVHGLADDLLPLPADEPFVALAPSMSGGSAPAPASATSSVQSATAASPTPAALRDDPLQRAALHEAADRERGALERIDRWHGPRQQRLALLALVDGRFDDEARQRWLQAHAGLSFADDTWRELAALGVDGRLQAFALLAARFAAHAPPDDRALLRQGLRALRREPDVALRRLWLARQAIAPGHARRDLRGSPLEPLAAEAAAATAGLAAAIASPVAARWTGVVVGHLGVAQPAPLRLWPLRRLRRLSFMARPQLVRLWVESASADLRTDPRFTEVIALACALLDTPRPQAPVGTADAQARSL
jgi:Zn-dependent protease with chaperone function